MWIHYIRVKMQIPFSKFKRQRRKQIFQRYQNKQEYSNILNCLFKIILHTFSILNTKCNERIIAVFPPHMQQNYAQCYSAISIIV